MAVRRRSSKLVRLARLSRSLKGTSLGDDTIGAMDDQTFKTTVLANQRELIESHKHWADGDRMQKWIAIAVTASIPVFSMIWRRLGVGRRGLRR